MIQTQSNILVPSSTICIIVIPPPKLFTLPPQPRIHKKITENIEFQQKILNNSENIYTGILCAELATTFAHLLSLQIDYVALPYKIHIKSFCTIYLSAKLERLRLN